MYEKNSEPNSAPRKLYKLIYRNDATEIKSNFFDQRIIFFDSFIYKGISKMQRQNIIFFKKSRRKF